MSVFRSGQSPARAASNTIVAAARRTPHRARRAAVMIPEGVAEMRRVLEAAAEGDFLDLDVPLANVGELIVRARKPHTPHMVADRLARFMKYLVQIAQRNS